MNFEWGGWKGERGFGMGKEGGCFMVDGMTECNSFVLEENDLLGGVSLAGIDDAIQPTMTAFAPMV